MADLAIGGREAEVLFQNQALQMGFSRDPLALRQQSEEPVADEQFLRHRASPFLGCKKFEPALASIVPSAERCPRLRSLSYATGPSGKAC
jgi:hypothetical protein